MVRRVLDVGFFVMLGKFRALPTNCADCKRQDQGVEKQITKKIIKRTGRGDIILLKIQLTAIGARAAVGSAESIKGWDGDLV